MKKKLDYYGQLRPFGNWHKLLLTMKIAVFLLFCCVMNIMAGPSYSQATKISLNIKDATIEQVLNKIEDVSEFYFLFNQKLIDVNRKVDVVADKEPIKDILAGIFAEDVKFLVYDRQIILLPEKATVPEDPFQQKTVTGSVTDSKSGEPLTGATVIVKGTTVGVTTSADGTYTIIVPDPNATLVVTFIGYKPVEIPVAGNSKVDVQLDQDVLKLEEIVVIGYGTSSKKALTGSISKVEPAVLLNNTAQNVGVALTGRVAGVQITQNSGNPEADINIRIRGVSSVYAGSQPLLVVDGVISGLSLRELNANDIASIEILKDASSGAIYGSRAANGVVLVTTKAGIVGKSQIEFEYTYGNNTITNWLPIADGPQYLSIMDKYWSESLPSRAGQKFTSFSINGLDGFDRTIAEKYNTDWKKIVTQPAYYNQFNLSASSGTEKTRFYLSGQYRDEYGYDAGLRIRRAIFRINLDHYVNKWVTVGTKIVANYTFRNNSYAGYSDYYGSLLPVYPVMSPSTLPARTGKYFYDRNLSGGQGINPLYRRDWTWGDQQTLRNVGDFYLELKPIKGLVFRTDWGLRFEQNRSRSYQSREFRRKGDGIDPNLEGSISYSRSEAIRYTGTNTITYDKTIGNHGISLLAGNSVDSYNNNGQGNTWEGFPTDYFTLTNANTEIVTTRQSISIDQNRFISYFGRARYDFKKRYFIDVNYRADYSSRFGKDNRWGYFPGVALSWILSDENFMKNISLINYAKVRFSLGTVGNSEVGNYPYLSQVVNWASYGGQPGFFFNTIGNNSIHWEKQLQTNVGIDFTILNNRISSSFDYFFKNVTDLIVNNKINNYMGYFSTAIVQNLGGLENKGFDILITSRNIDGQFKWITDFNISRSRSKVTKLSPQQRFIQSGYNMVVEGQPLGAYYLPIYAGLDPVTGHEMIYTVNPAAEWTRQPTVSDLSGNVIDLNRSTNNGNHSVLLTDQTPYPKFYGGINNTFSYKGLELSATLTFQYGNYIYDQGIQSLMSVSTTGSSNFSPDLLNAWTKANPTNIPLLSAGGTTRFLYDGSYMRLKNVQLSYTYSGGIMKKMNFDGSLTFRAGAQNLLTFTKYPGIDPEFFKMDIGATDPSGGNLGGNISPGIAGLGNPQVRTIFFSINLSF